MSGETAQTLEKTTLMHEEEYALLQDLENCNQDILGELSVLVDDDNNLDNTQVHELVLDDKLINTLTTVILPDGTEAFVAESSNLNDSNNENTALSIENGAIILQDIEGVNEEVIEIQLDPVDLKIPNLEKNNDVDVQNVCSQLQVIDGILYFVTETDLQVQDDEPKDNQSNQNEDDLSKNERECPKDDCTKVYSTSHHLDHEKTHTDQRPYPCNHPKCKKSFSTGYSLKAHLRTHTGEKPYKCTNEECDKRFKTSGDLLKHIRTHTGERPFVCPYEDCGRSFTTSNIRKVHVRTHTGERPFKCPEPKCGKAFASSTNYKNHVRIHSGEKPYVCMKKNCGKRFTEYSSLYKHNVVHAPQKPYICEICRKRYRQHSTLVVHMKTAHSMLDSDTGVLDILLQNSAEMIDQSKYNHDLESMQTDASQDDKEAQTFLVDDPSQLLMFQVNTTTAEKPEDNIDTVLKDLNLNMLFNLD